MEQEDKLYMNGQEVELKNPGTKGLADFLKLARIMSRVPKDTSPEKFIEYFDDEAIDAMVRLLNLTLIKTFPNMPEEERDSWGMKNSMLIFPHIIRMCVPKNMTNDQERAERLKERINAQSAN